MAQFQFSRLDTTTQGIILFTLGVVLLLYALNIFTAWFNAILIICAFSMLVIGAIKLELPNRLKKLVNKR